MKKVSFLGLVVLESIKGSLEDTSELRTEKCRGWTQIADKDGPCLTVLSTGREKLTGQKTHEFEQ